MRRVTRGVDRMLVGDIRFGWFGRGRSVGRRLVVCTTYSAGMVVVVKEKLRMLVNGGMRFVVEQLAWFGSMDGRGYPKGCVV